MVKKVDWNELTILTSYEAKEAIANMLNECGAGGVVIEEKSDLHKKRREKFGEIYELDEAKYDYEEAKIKAYFLQNEAWPQLLEQIKDKIEALESYGIDLGENKLTVKTVKETDWENEWKKYFKPLEVGRTFLIVPEWEQVEDVSEEKRIIRIDPGMAFGTGTHETTSLSIEALEKVIKSGDEVIDVGSGSGILSIAASLLGAERVYSYDLDEVAVNSSMSNRDLNNLTDKIIVEQNNLLKNKHHEADVIVANILTHILLELVEDAYRQLKKGGYFITSGIITSQEQKLKDKMIEQGFEIIERLQENHWVTFLAKK